LLEVKFLDQWAADKDESLNIIIIRPNQVSAELISKPRNLEVDFSQEEIARAERDEVVADLDAEISRMEIPIAQVTPGLTQSKSENGLISPLTKRVRKPKEADPEYIPVNWPKPKTKRRRPKKLAGVDPAKENVPINQQENVSQPLTINQKENHLILKPRILKVKIPINPIKRATVLGVVQRNVGNSGVQPIVKCGKCGKMYAGNDNYEKHLDRDHTVPLPYHCHMCSKSFRKQHTLKAHVDLDHRGPKKYCRFCDKIYSRDWARDAHEKKAHGHGDIIRMAAKQAEIIL